MSLAELVREATRHYARVLEREALTAPTGMRASGEASR
jgi:hypothetical protein